MDYCYTQNVRKTEARRQVHEKGGLIISYESREIESYTSCLSQAEVVVAFFLSYTYLRKSVYDKRKIFLNVI